MRTRILVALAVAGLAASAGVAAPAGPGAGSHTVRIYAPRGGPGRDCARVLPLRRTVVGPAVLRGALRSLLAGPTAAERHRGYGGWFSARTAGRLRSVRLAGGVAYVDFRDFRRLIPNASSSCGSALLLAQLDRTVRQFPAVRAAVYSFGGDRAAFYEWLQREAPT
jgi:Sporulation and spore germination